MCGGELGNQGTRYCFFIQTVTSAVSIFRYAKDSPNRHTRYAPPHYPARCPFDESLFSPEDYRLFKELMKEQCERFGVRIVAYCLMTSHLNFRT